MLANPSSELEADPVRQALGRDGVQVIGTALAQRKSIDESALKNFGDKCMCESVCKKVHD